MSDLYCFPWLTHLIWTWQIPHETFCHLRGEVRTATLVQEKFACEQSQSYSRKVIFWKLRIYFLTSQWGFFTQRSENTSRNIMAMHFTEKKSSAKLVWSLAPEHSTPMTASHKALAGSFSLFMNPPLYVCYLSSPTGTWNQLGSPQKNSNYVRYLK
jgi:hypothetical protein